MLDSIRKFSECLDPSCQYALRPFKSVQPFEAVMIGPGYQEDSVEAVVRQL